MHYVCGDGADGRVCGYGADAVQVLLADVQRQAWVCDGTQVLIT